MKKLTTILSLIILAVVITSCSNKKSLQGYLVDSQEKKGFITVDVPSSILQLKSDNVSEDVKATLKSIRKINVVAMPIKGHEDTYEAEKNKIKDILKNSDYKSLMRMSDKGMKMNLYYTGSEDAIDEVIAFGYGDKAGVGIARILGEDMNPAKIIEMMKNVRIDGDAVDLKGFSAIFESAKK